MSSIKEKENIRVEDSDNSPIDGEEFEFLNKKRGAARMETFRNYMDGHKNGKFLLITFYCSIYLVAWAYALSTSVTTSLSPLATSSYSEHSTGLALLSIATAIISSVAKPFLAKIADSASRPVCYTTAILFFMVGYIVVGTSKTMTAYVVGAGISAVGTAGLDFMHTLLIADLTSLKWRGMMMAVISSPYIYNCWFASFIVADLEISNWRWGYAMFAIIIPVCALPALYIMYVYEAKAIKSYPVPPHKQVKGSFLYKVYHSLMEVDALGLLMLGFGFCLVLLPLSLYATVTNGWKNPSIIAMFVCGGVILISFLPYEMWVAKYPILPKHDWNRTLVCSLGTDFWYFVQCNLTLVYYSSYAYVVHDFGLTSWSNFNNITTATTCVFGLIAGAIYRYTHRYKAGLLVGFAIDIISAGILLSGHRMTTINLAALVMSSLLLGVGGGFVTVGSGVAIQASVPHPDLGMAISLQALISGLGGSLGTAISAVVWESKMPIALRTYLPSSVTDLEVTDYFGSIYDIVLNPMGSEVRDGCITAYRKVAFYLFASALGVSFVPLIGATFQANYYLGNEHAAVEDKPLALKQSDLEEQAGAQSSSESAQSTDEKNTDEKNTDKKSTDEKVAEKKIAENVEATSEKTSQRKLT